MVEMLMQRFFWLFIVSSMAVSAVEYDPERYDPILDRSPFGEDPTIPDQDDIDRKNGAEALAAAKKMEKEMRLCYLLETQSGEVRAGFQNLKARAGDPRSIMLMVGERYNEMELSEIDLATSSATILLNGKRVIFRLTQSAAPVPVANAPVQSERRTVDGFRAKPPEPTLSSEERTQNPTETTERLHQYQMEVIRTGMPPLPVPLTKEMDDQLVAEGILPPNEAL